MWVIVRSRPALRPRGVGLAMLIALAVGIFGGGPIRSAHAIEMFTFFGDGSRIGLPSLEVPIEAYPGIPLRSDRIRMRTGRFARGWRGGAARGAMARETVELDRSKPAAAGGITIRPMDPSGRPAMQTASPTATAPRRTVPSGPSRPLPDAPLPPE